MVGVLHLLTLKIQKTLNKSFAKLYQASVALLGSQNRESIGNSLFIHCTLVKKQGTGLGGDISMAKVVKVSGEMNLPLTTGKMPVKTLMTFLVW